MFFFISFSTARIILLLLKIFCFIYFFSDLSDNTLELLFEVYDKADSRFLGLGIVGIEELIATPSQRQVIPLQARPCENDVVSGSLTCEVCVIHYLAFNSSTFNTWLMSMRFFHLLIYNLLL